MAIQSIFLVEEDNTNVFTCCHQCFLFPYIFSLQSTHKPHIVTSLFPAKEKNSVLNTYIDDI